jgi:hypothetical protein
MRTSILLTVVAVLCLVSCGDDDNPMAGSGNIIRVRQTLNVADMSYNASYISIENQTEYRLLWATPDMVVRNYAPGKQVQLVMEFDPPLETRHDNVPVTFLSILSAETGSTSRLAVPDAEAQADDWHAVSVGVQCGQNSATDASYFNISAGFQEISTAGATMQHLTITFTVPETYTQGGDAGSPVLPGDIHLTSLLFSTYLDGNTSAADPPVWPGEYTPPAPAR